MNTDPSAVDPAVVAAIADADLRVLAMCLVHLTGERRWIESPFRPRRDVRLVADPSAGLTTDAQDQLRTAAARVLSSTRATVIDDPGPDLFHEMMNACLGEEVPADYVPLMREEMGFVDGDAHWSVDDPAGAVAELRGEFDSTVVIIGAGVAGLGLAVKLDALGIDWTIVEKNADVGGTWFENRYPGAAVDTPNQFYSYSYAPDHGWSRHFSPRPELQAYLERFATDRELRDRICFGTELIGAAWDERQQGWTVRLRVDGAEVERTCRVLVAAIGHFNRPNDIGIEGSSRFTGPLFHSARWPDGLDVRGKRVAVVGTGASSTQIVPAIAPMVSSLTIYQRTPQWVRPVPGLLDPVPAGTRWLLDNVPYYQRWLRFTLFWRYGDGLLQYLRKDPAWEHPERSLNRVNERHRVEMTRHIEDKLAGRPDLLSRCLPSYPPYGKRILLDGGWFDALRRDNVELVTDAIDHVDETGIVTSDGTHRAADVVVMALGFTVHDHAARLGIVGRDGRELSGAWAGENPKAHLGITVPGYPNLFCMYGPNTNTGHGGSAFLLAESQSRYITGAVVALADRGARSMECREEVLDDYVARLDAEHANLIWTHPGTTTYYRNSHGRVVSVMPWRLVDYWRMTHAPDPEEFVFRS